MCKMWRNSVSLLFCLYFALITILSLSNDVSAVKSKVPKETLPKGPPTYDVKLFTMRQFEGSYLIYYYKNRMHIKKNS